MYEYGNDQFVPPPSCTASNADTYPWMADHFHLGNTSETAPSTAFTSPSVFPNNYQARLITENNEFDSINDTLLFAALKSEIVDDYSNINNSSTSSSSVHYGSAPSPSCYVMQRPSLIQRSMSGHSLLHKNGFFHPSFSSLEEYRQEILNMETGINTPMRKVFSTGDIQTHQSESTTSLHENCMGSEGIKKVGRYSAEERKERIEKYRSKRNQRNFTKKIKYACRKTLADSRPRVRGRFMRNEEPCESSQTQWNQMIGGEYEDDEVWINFLDALTMNQNP